MQKDIHESFIERVKTKRKNKLKAEDDEIFNGKFWSGKEALSLGLIDNIGFYEEVLKQRYGDNIIYKNIEGSKGFFKKKLGANYQIEIIKNQIIDIYNEINIWSRYKL